MSAEPFAPFAGSPRLSRAGRVNGGVLVDVRRGEALDTLELIDDAGNVLLAHAHGIHDDERLRTREALLWLLRGRLARAPQ